MERLSESRIRELLAPYVLGSDLPPTLVPKLGIYLDLLLRWNARTNLTAVRAPEDLVQRQWGESLFAAQSVPSIGTVLDFGSGAGFPGIPLALARPDLHVTLAESQNKKASFLKEAVRVLELSCEIWPSRVERLPLERQFDVVTMRAVDQTQAMLSAACARVATHGVLVRYLSRNEDDVVPDMNLVSRTPVPRSVGSLAVFRSVSRR